MKKTTILFDITGVLVWENKLHLASKIGIYTLLRYSITHRKNPLNLCFDILKKKSLEEQPDRHTTSINYKGRPLPICVSEWQQGTKTSEQVHLELTDYIKYLNTQNYFTGPFEKEIALKILAVLFNNRAVVQTSRPNKKLIKLVKQIKKDGTYKLFIVSNMAHETFELLEQAYPELLDLFEEVIISAEVGLLKPDKAMYQHVLTTYDLNPAHCIFIDDQQDNITAAQELGITSIVYKQFKGLKKQFKQFGII